MRNDEVYSYRDRRQAPAAGHATPAGPADPCAPRISANPAAKFSLRPRWTISRSSACRAKLNIDVAALEKDFYELSRKLHPGSERPRRQPGTGMEPRTEFPAQRRLSHPERSDQAHAISAALEGVELEEQSKSATEAGSRQRRSQETNRSSRSAGRSLRAEHAARRTAHEQEDGRRRSRSDRGNRTTESRTLEEKHESLLQELQSYWKEWDALIDRGRRTESADAEADYAARWWMF